MNIGIIGSGSIGATVGELWVAAGHAVLFSSRHPDALQPLVTRLAPGASRGTPAQAAAFGEVLLVSVPYAALPELGRELGPAVRGKVVLETGNPYPERDGEMAQRVRASGRGAGIASAEFLPGSRLVRAFNSVFYKTLAAQAHRAPPRLAIPLASDDAQALEVAARLVAAAGFEPVPVGGLDRAKDFDVGTAVYNRALTAAELRRALGLS